VATRHLDEHIQHLCVLLHLPCNHSTKTMGSVIGNNSGGTFNKTTTDQLPKIFKLYKPLEGNKTKS